MLFQNSLCPGWRRPRRRHPFRRKLCTATRRKQFKLSRILCITNSGVWPTFFLFHAQCSFVWSGWPYLFKWDVQEVHVGLVTIQKNRHCNLGLVIWKKKKKKKKLCKTKFWCRWWTWNNTGGAENSKHTPSSTLDFPRYEKTFPLVCFVPCFELIVAICQSCSLWRPKLISFILWTSSWCLVSDENSPVIRWKCQQLELQKSLRKFSFAPGISANYFHPRPFHLVSSGKEKR